MCANANLCSNPRDGALGNLREVLANGGDLIPWYLRVDVVEVVQPCLLLTRLKEAVTAAVREAVREAGREAGRETVREAACV